MTMTTAAILPTSPAPLDIGIGGMTCASCVARVEKALKKVPGVETATVNLATESARIVYAPGEQMEARLRRGAASAAGGACNERCTTRLPRWIGNHTVIPGDPTVGLQAVEQA